MRLSRAEVVSVVVSALLVCLCALCLMVVRETSKARDHIKVGFVYDGDETEPYTYNFMSAQRALASRYGDAVEVSTLSNVPDDDGAEAIQALVDEGCDLIFTTSWGYGDVAKGIAAEHPEVEFCQATCANANDDPVLPNYHTFMGHIYEGRYVSGIVAGLKVQEMVNRGVIVPEQAKVGFVAAYEQAENISAYTAFLLGVRHVVPTATMEVHYVHSWSDYPEEHASAERLIEDGCVVISQSTNTIGPALACEEAGQTHEVYHVGYNESMSLVAPTMALVSTRINWSPYMIAATGAVLDGIPVEQAVAADVHGQDAGAGFDHDWVQMLDLNPHAAAEGSQEVMETTIDKLKRAEITVFQGDYVGVSARDPHDVLDLSDGYEENADSSAPSFDYVLEDVITFV